MNETHNNEGFTIKVTGKDSVAEKLFEVGKAATNTLSRVIDGIKDTAVELLSSHNQEPTTFEIKSTFEGIINGKVVITNSMVFATVKEIIQNVEENYTYVKNSDVEYIALYLDHLYNISDTIAEWEDACNELIMDLNNKAIAGERYIDLDIITKSRQFGITL